MFCSWFRAPFGLFYHAAWFTQAHHKQGFIMFLDAINAMKDVFLVTNWQALQWVRDPTPLSRINNFQPFQCNYQVTNYLPLFLIHVTVTYGSFDNYPRTKSPIFELKLSTATELLNGKIDITSFYLMWFCTLCWYRFTLFIETINIFLIIIHGIASHNLHKNKHFEAAERQGLVK